MNDSGSAPVPHRSARFRRSRRLSPPRTALSAAALTALAALLAPIAATPAHAIAPDGVAGSGTSADPYQVDAPEDLTALAAMINEDPDGYAASHIDLVADIDMTGQAPFTGIDRFSGTLDGLGHTIGNLSYGTGSAGGADTLALIRTLDGGTVSHVTLDGVAADNGTSTGYVAGVAAVSKGGTIEGVAVLDAELTGTATEKVGGLVAEAEGGTLSDNVVDAKITANEMPAGVAAYAKGDTKITRNLVSAELTMLTGGGENGTKGNDAGFLVGYPGTPNSGVFSGNVALSGSISYTGKVDGFVGRMVGFTGYDGWTAENNLASPEITVSGAAVTGPGTKNQHGTDTAASALAEQGTYEKLGWDFGSTWAFDTALGHPMPKYTYSLVGSGTEDSPFEIATASDLEFLADQLNAGDTRYTEAENFAITADLDFTGRDPFPGIDTLTAALDGQGHRITGLVYGPSDASPRLGLIRELTGGTVENLVLDGVTAHVDGGDAQSWAAAIAVVAQDATISGVSVIGADFVSEHGEKVAGLAAELRGSSRVENNWVDGSFTADRMPGGLVGYATDTAAIRDNLVSAKAIALADGGAGTRGTDAALVVSYPGNGNRIEVRGNVAFSGGIDYSGTVPGFAGRVVGYYQPDGGYRIATLADNLANAEILVGGQAVTGTATEQHGADTAAAKLGEQATYEKLGWDFGADWTFDEQLGHPIPRFVRAEDQPERIAATMFGDSQTQRGFSWYAGSGTTGTVQVSKDRDLAEPASFEAAGRGSASGETVFQTTATGLEPGTRYFYRVGDAATQVWSPIGSFVTSDGDSDFTFVDLTDTQSQNADEAALSAATIEKSLATVPSAEFVMHNGDVVEHGDREQDWSDLMGAAQSSLLSTTVVPASGNHDQSTNAFTDHFALEAPNGQSTASGAYYSFDYNRAHISVLNTNEDGTQSVSDAQLAWLRDDITRARENGALWTIVTMHKGLYTTANHLDDGDVIAMRDKLAPLMDELNIDLVLQGHDHVMSRTKVLGYDPNGVEDAKVVETNVITEIADGKRTEYSVSPDGTIYFLPNTAGAKHYQQAKTADSGIDIEQYLQLFDRTGEQSTENFVAVRVTDSRLTLDVYDIRDRGVPRLFESFGIDHEIAPVDAQITGLPAVDELTIDDADAVAAVRAAVDALTSAQRGGLEHLAELEEREAKIRELSGATVTDGSEIGWAVPGAEKRLPVSVSNPTRTELSAAPVRVELEDAGEKDSSKIRFAATDGTPLPVEVESWDPSGTSVVWVRVPELAPSAAMTVWAYLGSDATPNHPEQVWEGDYSLVEHFAEDADAGSTLVDSTGSAEGTVVGKGLQTSTDAGDGSAQLGDVRLQYPGDIGGDDDRISISSVVSLTAEQLAALTGNAPIVAKESKTGDGQATFWQGIITDGAKLGTRLAGNSFEFGNVDLSHRFDFAADGERHLVTQTYDGMTYSVFVDGREVHSEMLEYRSTYGDPAVQTTIGDYFTNDGTLSSPFTGKVSEVQIAGVAFSPEYEEFRYQNLIGDAVRVGDAVSEKDAAVSVAISSPAEGATVEAGLREVTGTLSTRAELVAELGGDEVFREKVDAGAFSVEMPLNRLGEQELTLRAEAEDGGSGEDSTKLRIEDTVAPKDPAVSDDSATASAQDPDVELTVTPDSDDREQLETKFYANATVPLSSENTTVRTGSTDDRTPQALTPESGEETDQLAPTTVGDDANPYQITEVTLTEAQAAEDRLHFAWSGTGDDRRVSAYVWNTGSSSWTLKDSGSDADGGDVSLDVETTADDHAVSKERTVSILIWRGLAQDPWTDRDDYTAEPEKADYDWGVDHVPDTQLYAQATPERMIDQFSYVADRAEDRDTRLIVQSGDLVNREYLSQEYQWKDVEPALAEWEDEDLPYLVSWGNHDYSDARNGRVMLPKYYPMERFAESLEGSDWSFGGSQSIDNYYYTGEVDGAKLLMLTVGFFSADNPDDAGLAWAADVIEANPDRTVILAIHNTVNIGANSWSNDNVMRTLIDPFSNVKLVLGGHITGTGVAMHQRADGTTAYGILTDYQGRIYGGQEYLRHLSIDAENGLLYANTYSPMLDTATSDGPWHSAIDETQITGFHGSDSENFVLELDLGGSSTRTLATGSLSLAVGDPIEVGEAASTVGDESAKMVLTGAKPGVEYEWYADLTDEAGHTTRSPVSTFTISDEAATAPGAPTDVAASANGDTVHVTWNAPSDDGGSPITGYEITVGDHRVTVDGATLSVDVPGLEPGEYEVTVTAISDAGSSKSSEPVRVTVEDSGEQPTPTPTVSVTGSFTPGGEIVVSGEHLAPNTPFTVELHSDPVTLGEGTAAADGSFTLPARIPNDLTVGSHDVVVLQNGEPIASARILVTAADDGQGGGTEPGGSDGSGTDGGSDGSAGSSGSSTDGSATDGLGGHLATTGGSAVGGWIAVGGILLVALGAALLIARRRGGLRRQ